METLKNFLTGFVITILAFLVLALGFIMWPVLAGLGSLIIFVAVIILAVILAFYIIVLIGYVVRKAFSPEGASADRKKKGAPETKGRATSE